VPASGSFEMLAEPARTTVAADIGNEKMAHSGNNRTSVHQRFSVNRIVRFDLERAGCVQV